MRKDRNCSNNMYPTYPSVMPMPMPIGQMPNNMINPNMGFNSSYDEQINSLSSRLNSLERRVSALENNTPQVTPLNTYNDTNFYMM